MKSTIGLIVSVALFLGYSGAVYYCSFVAGYKVGIHNTAEAVTEYKKQRDAHILGVGFDKRASAQAAVDRIGKGLAPYDEKNISAADASLEDIAADIVSILPL